MSSTNKHRALHAWVLSASIVMAAPLTMVSTASLVSAEESKTETPEHKLSKLSTTDGTLSEAHANVINENSALTEKTANKADQNAKNVEETAGVAQAAHKLGEQNEKGIVATDKNVDSLANHVKKNSDVSAGNSNALGEHAQVINNHTGQLKDQKEINATQAQTDKNQDEAIAAVKKDLDSLKPAPKSQCVDGSVCFVNASGYVVALPTPIYTPFVQNFMTLNPLCDGVALSWATILQRAQAGVVMVQLQPNAPMIMIPQGATNATLQQIAGQQAVQQNVQQANITPPAGSSQTPQTPGVAGDQNPANPGPGSATKPPVDGQVNGDQATPFKPGAPHQPVGSATPETATDGANMVAIASVVAFAALGALVFFRLRRRNQKNAG